MKTISTQIRLPENIHSYITEEAARLGIAKNAVLVMLLDKGRQVWETKPEVSVNAKSYDGIEHKGAKRYVAALN